MAGGPIDVLIVDDDRDIRALLRIHLDLDDRFGTVREAGDAAEARRLARAHPGLRGVILDQEMPGETGIEVLPALRAQLPAAAIVMFTSDESIHADALARGAAAAYVKTTPLRTVLDRLAAAAAP